MMRISQSVYAKNLDYQLFSFEFGAGSILAKPYSYLAQAEDFRNANPSASAREAHRRKTPVCGVLAAFGAQGGQYGLGGHFGGGVSGKRDDWNRTNQDGQARYRGGTAGGGFCFFPPEIGMHALSDLEPDGVTLSTVYFMVGGTSAFFGAGTPELARGSINSGFSWGIDSGARLVFRTHSAVDGSVTEIFRLNTTGNYEFKSGTSFYGTLNHGITAARTWTFEDVTGNVPVATGSPALGGGAVATLGTIGGSGPTVAAQSVWKAMVIDGVAGFVAFWV